MIMSKNNINQELEESVVYLGYIEDNDALDHELSTPPLSDDLVEVTAVRSNLDTSLEPWLVNKIGGLPIFPCDRINIEELYSTLDSLICKHCKSKCMLVFQINSPVDDVKADRIQQIYSCVKSDCIKHSWFSLRCMLEERVVQDFPSELNPELEKLEVMKDQVFGNVVVCTERAYFAPYYVTVIEEPTGRENFAKNNLEALKLASKFSDPDLKPATIEAKYKNLKNYKPPQPPSKLSDLDDFEKFQMENLYRNDKAMYRFYKRLGRYQAQVVRYDWEGKPLLNSNKIKLQIQPCPTCSSKRTFEFQLMSALINYLKPMKEGVQFDRESLDFSSIITHSCLKNCLTKTFNIEDTYFMPDPDSRVFNKLKQRMISLKIKSSDDEVDKKEGVSDEKPEEGRKTEKPRLPTGKKVVTFAPSTTNIKTKKKKKNKK